MRFLYLRILSTLEGIGEEVCNNFAGWTVLDGQFPQLDMIGDEEVPDVDVVCPLAAGGETIGLKVHSGFVVLKQDVLLDVVSLYLNEVHGPDDLR